MRSFSVNQWRHQAYSSGTGGDSWTRDTHLGIISAYIYTMYVCIYIYVVIMEVCEIVQGKNIMSYERGVQTVKELGHLRGG